MKKLVKVLSQRIIITIVVMIILASATIITLSNTNIINKAQDAVEKTDISQIKEECEVLKWQLAMVDSELTQSELIAKLNEHFSSSTVDGNTLLVKNGKYSIAVNENLIITVTKSGSILPDDPEVPGGDNPDEPDTPEGPVEQDIWSVYNIYDALANVSNEALASYGLDKNRYSTTYLKVESVYNQYTLQEYKEQYIVSAMLGAEVLNVTVDDLVLLNFGMTSMDDLLALVSQEAGQTVTRDQLIYELLFQVGSVDLALQSMGYVPAEIEAEYATFVQPQLPDEYLTQTYTITFPDKSTETVQGTELTSYVGRYGILQNGSYDITISDGTESQTYTTTISGIVAESYEDDYYIYTLQDDGYAVAVKDKTLSTYGEILTEIEGIPIVSLYYTFDGCTNLTAVPEIPNTVTSMVGTFSGCTSLTTIPNIPTSVTNMGSTFYGCTNLTTVPTLPNSVTTMQSTFSGCTSLTTIPNIPTSVTYMYYTFSGCTGLTTVPTLPSGVTDMTGTFNNCTSLTTIPNIPTSVTNMGSTFYGCTGLTTVENIPTSVTNMGGTFSGCTSLTTVPTLPNTVTNMNHTFYECTNLTTVENIPTNVKDMSHTFYECSNLTTITTIQNVPLTDVTNMEWTFYRCSKLTAVPDISSLSLTNMTYAFEDCKSLTIAPILPNSVTNMDRTFYNCSNLIIVENIPTSVTSMIGTFYECTSLAAVPALPNSVTDMRFAFYGCSNLTTIPNIPTSVTNMSYTFQYCYKLKGILHINTTDLTNCVQAFLDTGTEGSGLTVVVPNDTVRQMLINDSHYSSSVVSIVASLQ